MAVFCRPMVRLQGIWPRMNPARAGVVTVQGWGTDVPVICLSNVSILEPFPPDPTVCSTLLLDPPVFCSTHGVFCGIQKQKSPCFQGLSVERETGFEPATSTLARLHSTTELLPLFQKSRADNRSKRHRLSRIDDAP